MAIERCGTLATVSDRYQLCAEGVYGPTDRSYWVVEGRFAAGAYPSKKGYPGSGPIPKPLEQLLEAGIDVFVTTIRLGGGVGVHASLVGEGGGSHVRGPDVREKVGGVVHEERQVTKIG